ncbi:MAG: carboxypeptidase-like regulatory domain-containing protein, partial [Candidatus Cloacimonadota bacterium]|nr:carboxypeptidase-like regulatory domain-containing protein [Candidatus Cloacimonadota bacterium]
MTKINKLLAVFIVVFGLLFIGCEEDPSGPEEPGTVEGIVTNANTGEALGGATINDGTSDVAISGTGGTYSFQTDEGTYTFTCTAEGYNMQVVEDIEVYAGESTNVNFQLQPITVVLIENNIVGNTTWTNNNIYVIEGEIYIRAVLTINPGTRIKFKDGADWIVQGAEGGLIVAEGSEFMPIIFTSWHDDAYGGDTNGNGDATEPARGDWDDIDIQGDNNTSTFDYCEFYYGGGYYDKYVMYLDPDTEVRITNCTFAHNQGEEGALNAHEAGDGTIIQNNIFYDNIWPLNINATFDLDDSNIFHALESRSAINDHNGILVEGNDFDGQITWSETEVPFVLQEGEYLIPAGISLTLEPGVTLKLDTGVDLWINGTITGNGTISAPVIFTSYKDDDVIGDTNNDDDVTSPNAGDWDYLMLQGINNSSSFNYCEFYYGGGYSSTYTLCLDNDTAVNVSSCLFINNDGSDDPVLDASHAGANTTIIGNAFYNNVKPLMINGRMNLDSSNTFHNLNNPSQSNIKNGIFVYPGSDVEGNISWEELEVPFVLSSEM